MFGPEWVAGFSLGAMVGAAVLAWGAERRARASEAIVSMLAQSAANRAVTEDTLASMRACEPKETVCGDC